MLSLWPALALFAAALLATALLTRAVLEALERRQILDMPNERSSHARPVPRGGGIAVTAVVLAFWAGLAALGLGTVASPELLAVAAALALLSWWDDRHSLPVLARLLPQALAVAVALAAGSADALLARLPIPAPLAYGLLGLAWLWFVNLYNFMDGIDGISGVETASIGIGVALLAVVAADFAPFAPEALALAGAGAGFLVWNWHPARVFLGDVGSIPLGFLAGALLIAVAGAGGWAAALILPLYYLADATLTLLRRAARGEPFWRAHRQHAYQRALAGKDGHDRIAILIAANNLVLAALAILSLRAPLFALAAAGLVVAILIWRFETYAAQKGA